MQKLTTTSKDRLKRLNHSSQGGLWRIKDKLAKKGHRYCQKANIVENHCGLGQQIRKDLSRFYKQLWVGAYFPLLINIPGWNIETQRSQYQFVSLCPEGHAVTKVGYTVAGDKGP